MRPRQSLVVVLFAFLCVCGATGWFTLHRKSPDPVDESAEKVDDSAEELSDAKKFASDLIMQTRSDHKEFILRMATQSTPTVDDAEFVRNYLKTFSRFANNPRFRRSLPNQVGAAHHHLGMLHAFNGDFRLADQSLEQSIEIADGHGNAQASAYTKNTRAYVLASVGDKRSALEMLQQTVAALRDSPNNAIVLAIALRNIGVLKHATGADGTAALTESIAIFSRQPSIKRVGMASDLAMDTKMILCKQVWSQGDLERAIAICSDVRDDLADLVPELRDTTLRKDIVSPDRYASARHFAQHNLKTLSAQKHSIEGTEKAMPSSDAWTWRPLFNLRTELVPDDSTVTVVMQAEFDPQSNFVLPWGMRQWARQATLDIAQSVHERVNLTVLVDSDDSLESAQEAFAAADIPRTRVRFKVYNFESPWFRDAGPIVGSTPSGDTIWFDSQLAREGAFERCAFDAIPRFLSRTQSLGLVSTPLYVEGGSILSDGQGLTVCSSWLLDRNQELGISESRILRELHRITGAKFLAPIEPLDDEPTGHVDLFMTIPAPQTVVIGQYRDPQSRDAQLLDEHARRFAEVQIDDKNVKVVRIPMPENRDGIVRTYTNVVYANGVLLVPSYSEVDPAMEQEVEKIYQRLLPTWEIKFIDCSQIIRKGGALHCLVSNLGTTAKPLSARVDP